MVGRDDPLVRSRRAWARLIPTSALPFDPTSRGAQMRKLAVVEFVTLDGVVQGLGSPDEDREGGFEYGGGGGPYGDEGMAAQGAKGMSSTGVNLFGGRPYEKRGP